VDFGLAIMKPTAFNMIPGLESFIPKFVSAKASVGTAALVGVDPSILTVKAQDIEINVNTFYWPIPDPVTQTAVNAGLQLFGPPSINYAQSASFKNFTEDLDGDGVLRTSTEDKNSNGWLDSGEDLNSNGLLDLSEDRNKNGRIDRAGRPRWAMPRSTWPALCNFLPPWPLPRRAAKASP
jgi:hypothetical protein